MNKRDTSDDVTAHTVFMRSNEENQNLTINNRTVLVENPGWKTNWQLVKMLWVEKSRTDNQRHLLVRENRS